MLEMIILFTLCVPSAVIFRYKVTVGVAHAIWHNIKARLYD